ncbi:TPA: hypothetical protein H1005_02735 [archaeon]|uniref:Uncharacterized protein n=1 Tax=Candidatus Naiadarchaeum limnaeum TaxID=2756139 RepID=A0A832UMH0_9ARCH|nr:hypothetical protein [Candidatus Naiadarchaeales archaeon SRR2090153.bin1042]HIJ99923.1 hypothetical protein [Candidatus Naiadarchaeum limnaeum]
MQTSQKKWTKERYLQIVLAILFLAPLIFVPLYVGAIYSVSIGNVIYGLIKFYLLVPMGILFGPLILFLPPYTTEGIAFSMLFIIPIIISLISYKKLLPYVGVKQEYKELYTLLIFYIVLLCIGLIIGTTTLILYAPSGYAGFD